MAKKRIEMSQFALKLRNIHSLLYDDIFHKKLSQVNFLNQFFPDLVVCEVEVNMERYIIDSCMIGVSKCRNGFTSKSNTHISAICGSLFGMVESGSYRYPNDAKDIQEHVSNELVYNCNKLEKMRNNIERMLLDFSEKEYNQFDMIFTNYIQGLTEQGRNFNRNDKSDFRIPDLCYQELEVRIRTQWENDNIDGKTNSFMWMLLGALLGPKIDYILIEYTEDFSKRTINTRETQQNYSKKFSSDNKDSYSIIQSELKDEELYLRAMKYFSTENMELDIIEAIYCLKKSADMGNSKAQTRLGICYEEGTGVEKNYKQAVYLYHKSALNGNVLGQYHLGMCYKFGIGVSKNIDNAIEWLTKAAKQENNDARNALSLIFMERGDVEKNINDRLSWYKKASEFGNSDANYIIGMYYLNGQGIEKDIKLAENLLSNSAKENNVNAQFCLAECYAKGTFGTQRLDYAASWYEKAAKRDTLEAQYIIGTYYANGIGVLQDWGRAVYWYRKAADNGMAEAQCDLGKCYENGNGVENNDKLAAQYYEKAARKGYADAQYHFGLCHDFGIGVSHDESEAIIWYRRAAEQNHSNAQICLAMCYLGGEIIHDISSALYWLKKAHILGNNRAVFLLSEYYRENWRMESLGNKDEATGWIIKAAKLGDLESRCWLDNRMIKYP